MSKKPPEIVSVGDAVIDMTPTKMGVSLEDAQTFRKSVGGSSAIFSTAIARLGGRAAIVSKVGDDDFGHYIAKTLANEGVDTANLSFSPCKTRVNFICIDEKGEKSVVFLHDNGPDLLLSIKDVDLDRLSKASVIHVNSSIFRSTVGTRTAKRLLSFAKEQKILVSYDSNVKPGFFEGDRKRDVHKKMLADADIVFGTVDELCYILQLQENEMLDLFEAGGRKVAVKKGANGCIVTWNGRVSRISGIKVDAIDSTGAGDTFDAAFLKLLIEGASPLHAAKFANAAGALKATRQGAFQGVPLRAEVDSFIRSHAYCEPR